MLDLGAVLGESRAQQLQRAAAPLEAQMRATVKVRALESIQWPFQEPKLEVPTIYKAYVRPM